MRAFRREAIHRRRWLYAAVRRWQVEGGGGEKAHRADVTAREGCHGPDERKAGRATQADGVGIACPRCACRLATVYMTRHFLGGVRRMRVCRHCGTKYQTIERSTAEQIKQAQKLN